MKSIHTGERQVKVFMKKRLVVMSIVGLLVSSLNPATGEAATLTNNNYHAYDNTTQLN